MKKGILERVRECQALPTLPTVALEVLAVTRSDDATAAQLAQVIAKDPALAGKLLRTVNSSFYGYSHSISSLHSAVVILGQQSVKTLALGFSLVTCMAGHQSGTFDHVGYWRRSLYAATAAQVLAKRVEPAHHEACFLAALLMDLGMLALEQVLGADYGELVATAKSHAELSELETKVLGADHQDVARFMAEQWQLPDLLGLPMACHHDPQKVTSEGIRPLAELVALSARCGDIFVAPAPMWPVADVRRQCMAQYGITEIECDSLLCNIAMRTKDLAPLFEIPIDGKVSYESILRKANDQLLDATRIDEAPSERRRAPRIPRHSDLAILMCHEGVIGQSTSVQLRDVSARGIGFVNATPITTGSQFLLRVPRKNAAPRNLLYRVVRCKQAASGGFAIGAELECVLRNEPLEDVIAPAARAAG